MEPLSVVTVTFEPEHRMLELQLRSLARFAEVPLDSVIVVDNGLRPMRHQVEQRIRRAAGELASSLRVVRPGPPVGPPHAEEGWYAQQALKLGAHVFVETPHYLVLDAKNHLVAPLLPEHIYDHAGLPLAGRHGYENHSLLEHVARSLIFFGITPEEHLDDFTPSSTPFVFRTDLAASLVARLQTEANPWSRVFQDHRVTEFGMYGAWAIHEEGTLDAVCSRHRAPTQTIWPGYRDAERVGQVLAELAARDDRWLAIHRRALAGLSARATHAIARTWVERGLFDGLTGAYLFALRCRGALYWQAAIRKATQAAERSVATG